MKYLWLLALLAAGASCSKHTRSEYTPYQPAYDREGMRVDPPTNVPIQYVAWCHLENGAVGAWMDSAVAAEGDRSTHMDRFPDHECWVLWRQKP